MKKKENKIESERERETVCGRERENEREYVCVPEGEKEKEKI